MWYGTRRTSCGLVPLGFVVIQGDSTMRKAGGLSRLFTDFANAVAKAAGRPYTFIGCVALVAIWGLCGPAASFSDTWQLIINTSTTIITFLMVFLIQNTQNRDNAAIQAKLDELIRVGEGDNKFIGIEHLNDHELAEILEEVEAYAETLHAERRRRSNDDRAAQNGQGIPA